MRRLTRNIKVCASWLKTPFHMPKMERKHKFTPEGDVPPELLPLVQAGDQRRFECLVELRHVLGRLVRTFELFPGLLDFFSHLFDRPRHRIYQSSSNKSTIVEPTTPTSSHAPPKQPEQTRRASKPPPAGEDSPHAHSPLPLSQSNSTFPVTPNQRSSTPKTCSNKPT